MKTKVTLTLEESNWQKFRIHAIESKTSASAIIDELIAEYLKKPKKPKERRKAKMKRLRSNGITKLPKGKGGEANGMR